MVNKSALRHRRSPEYIYPRDREHIAIRIMCARDEVSHVELIWWHRGQNELHEEAMSKGLADKFNEEWISLLEFNAEVKYIKYYFRITGTDESVCYIGETDIAETAPSDGYSFEFSSVGTGDTDDIPKWARGTVFYQIFPERFSDCGRNAGLHEYVEWDSLPDRDSFHGGNLRGIIEHIDYLVDLNVGCIYLNPIFKADFNHKYATTDYFIIDPDFGTEEDFRCLVNKCHDNGIRVMLDGVFNHTGIHFKPFIDVMEHKDSDYRDWFYIHSWPLDMDDLNYECVGDYCYMPKLNTGNPDVQDFILSVMSYWIEEYGIDGWRLDVADEVEGSLWTRARRMIRHEHPECLLLGETWGDAECLVGDCLKLDIMMNYQVRTAILDCIVKDSRPEMFMHMISTALLKYRRSVRLASYNLIGSHDTERVANNTDDGRKVNLAFAALFTLPGSPAIYYGDEIGMRGENDPGCRGGMVWNTAGQDSERLELVRALSRIKRGEEALREGDLHFIEADDSRGTVIYSRSVSDEEIIAVFNLSNECRNVELDLGEYEVKLSVGEQDYRTKSDGCISIAPVSCLILKRRRI